MKRAIKSIFILLLVCCLTMSMFCYASASGIDERSAVVPDPDYGGGTRTKLFTLSTSGLQNTKKSSISKSSLPSGATKIGISGTLKHTASSNINAYTIRAGFGYIIPSTGMFKPDAYRTYTTTTADVYYKTSSSIINGTTTIYAFVTNMSPSYGTVSGSVEVFALS